MKTFQVVFVSGTGGSQTFTVQTFTAKEAFKLALFQMNKACCNENSIASVTLTTL